MKFVKVTALVLLFGVTLVSPRDYERKSTGHSASGNGPSWYHSRYPRNYERFRRAPRDSEDTEQDDGIARLLRQLPSRQKQLTFPTDQKFFLRIGPNGLPYTVSEDELMDVGDNQRTDDDVDVADESVQWIKSMPSKDEDLMDADFEANSLQNDKEREKYLKARLLEKLSLDYLHDSEEARNAVQQNSNFKRSYFRERQADPESIQILLNNNDQDESPLKKTRRAVLDSWLRNSMYTPQGQLRKEALQDFVNFYTAANEQGSISSRKRVPSDRAGPVFLKDAESKPIYDKRYWAGSEEKIPYNSFLDNKEINVKKRSPDMHQEVIKRNGTGEGKKNAGTMLFRNETKNGTKSIKDGVEEARNVSKRAVDWSTYFGVDKRRSDFEMAKKMANVLHAHEKLKKTAKRSVVNEGNNNRVTTVSDLKDAEDKVIQDILKYIGARQGTLKTPKEMKLFKEKVLNQLANVYQLEQMRKDAIDNEKEYHDMERATEPSRHNKNEGKHLAGKKQVKRIQQRPGNKNDVYDKVLNIGQDQSSLIYNPDGLNGQELNALLYECPIVKDLIYKCNQIAKALGYPGEIFLPMCIVRQSCHICDGMIPGWAFGDACDFNFVNRATFVCGDSLKCHAEARRMFSTLQEFDMFFQENKCQECLAGTLERMMLQ